MPSKVDAGKHRRDGTGVAGRECELAGNHHFDDNRWNSFQAQTFAREGKDTEEEKDLDKHASELAVK